MLARFLRDAAAQVGVPPQEYALLVERLLTLLTSCDERREQQWELQSWWDFTGAERRSAAFQRFLADGLTRTLVAARGREMSARTGGLVLVQLLQDLTRAGGRADRVLDAPTSEVWIDPWVAHLEALGVELRLGEPVEALHLAGGRMSGATVAGRTVHADHYVAALPVEVMRQLASPALRAAEPRLKGLDRLVTRWMNGVLFYLDRDVPLVNGHAIYIDSEWSLTSISQKQFWPAVDLAQRGDGRTRGILSIDVSEWQRPGPSHRQGRAAVQPRGDLRRGLGPARGPPRRRARRRHGHRPLPRPGDRVPEPDGRRQPRAAARQHRRLVGRPPRRGHAHPEPVPRLRLRAHAHRPGDDGGRQRGGAAGGQRDPRRDPLLRAPLRGLARCASRARSPPPARSTACAGSSSTGRRDRRSR